MTEFHVAACSNCKSTIMLAYDYKEHGYGWCLWTELNKDVECCSNPQIEFFDDIMVEEEEPETLDRRITLVLEDFAHR